MLTRKQVTTLITRVCFHTSTEALATLLEHFHTFLEMKRNIFHYRTGTLTNQRNAVRFKVSTNPHAHSVSKQIVLSIFSQGVNIQSPWV